MPRRKSPKAAPEIFTTFQVAEFLNVSPPTVVNWVNSGLLRAHRTPGGHRRISRVDIVAFAKENEYPIPAAFSAQAPLPLSLPARRESAPAPAAAPVAAPVVAPTPPAPAPPAPPPAPKRRRVLIVDDERDLCMVWRDYLLMTDNYEVEIAHSGFAAGRIVERGFKPDLILLDIRLDLKNEGAMDGLELLKSLQKDPDFKSIPVIAVAGYDPRIQAQVRAGALVGHLEKPFGLSKLADAVAEALAGPPAYRAPTPPVTDPRGDARL